MNNTQKILRTGKKTIKNHRDKKAKNAPNYCRFFWVYWNREAVQRFVKILVDKIQRENSGDWTKKVKIFIYWES